MTLFEQWSSNPCATRTPTLVNTLPPPVMNRVSSLPAPRARPTSSPALTPALNGQAVDGCAGFRVGERAAVGVHEREGEVTSPAEAFVSG